MTFPSRSGESRPPGRPGWLPPIAVGLGFFLVGGLFTVLVAWQVSTDIETRLQESFSHEASDHARLIQARVDASEAMLTGLQGLFLHGGIERGDFYEYVGVLRTTPEFEAVQALEFTRAIARSDVAEFEAAVRADRSIQPGGYPNFAVFPSGTGAELFVVDYVEPMAGNEPAFGFDLASNPERKAGVEKARDTGGTVATEGIHLVQDETESTGFLLIKPVYEGQVDFATVEARQSAFVGVVNGVFRVDDLMSGVSSADSGMHLLLEDVGTASSTNTSVIYSSSSEPILEDGLRASVAIDVGDRRWRITASETVAGYGDPVLGAVPRVLIFIGLALSAAIAVAGFTIMTSRQRAAREAHRATQHLVAQADELRAARDKALEADRLKTAFLANMSHELRTPLNAVIGLSSVLGAETRGPLNEDQSDYVEKISNAGEHLLELIDDLLDLSRIEANDEVFDIGDVDLCRIVTESVEVITGSSQDAGIELIVELPQESIMVVADARRLRQVLINLLTNATKFTHLGGQVGIRAESDHWGARVTVWDSGVGIPEEDTEKVFEPFYQADTSLTRRYGGSGLGLALTKNIVERHGGTISVESKKGQGSRFTVVWPLARATAGAQEPETSSERRALAARGNRTVVIAEDNDANLMMMIDVVEDAGWQAIPVRNGRDAVASAKSEQPDLILMDIQMPIMDGLEATRLLKGDDEISHIPVLAVTALAMPDDRERCLEAGCDGYLAKPFTADELERAIHDVLSTVVTT